MLSPEDACACACACTRTCEHGHVRLCRAVLLQILLVPLIAPSYQTPSFVWTRFITWQESGSSLGSNVRALALRL